MRQVGAFCVGLLWIVVCGVGTVSAQSFSLPKITDMNGFLEIGQFNGSDPWARDRRVMTGWGFEISFDASGSPPKPADCTPQMCPEPSKYCTLEDKVRAKIEKDEGAAKEQEESEVIRRRLRRNARPLYEVFLGYHQLNLSRNIENNYELRAALRTLPSAGVYVTCDGGWCNGFYGGIGAGLETLANARVYNNTTGQIFKVTADTIPLTFAAGYVTPWCVFAQLTGNVRYFPSVGYDLPSGVTSLPPELPRSVNLSGWSFAVGCQIEINTP